MKKEKKQLEESLYELQQNVPFNFLLLLCVILMILGNIISGAMTAGLFIWNAVLLYFSLNFFINSIKLRAKNLHEILESQEAFEFHDYEESSPKKKETGEEGRAEKDDSEK